MEETTVLQPVTDTIVYSVTVEFWEIWHQRRVILKKFISSHFKFYGVEHRFIERRLADKYKGLNRSIIVGSSLDRQAATMCKEELECYPCFTVKIHEWTEN